MCILNNNIIFKKKKYQKYIPVKINSSKKKKAKPTVKKLNSK